MLKKLLLYLGLFVLITSALTAGYVYKRLHESQAPLDGKINFGNLENPVRILRDAAGIPHIFAEKHSDGLKALGFTVASERLFQMELTRRLVYGELAEVFGEPALTSDKLFRTLMLKKAAERMIDLEKKENRFDKQLWQDMESYFAGVNFFLESQPLPLELQLVGIKPKPFTPIDAYMMTGYMAFGFAIPMKLTPLLTQLGQKISAERLNQLRMDPPSPKGHAFSTSKTRSGLKQGLPEVTSQVNNAAQKSIELEKFFSSLGLPRFEGSNAWLLSPKMSTSGKSLFANDPHIGFTNPAIWFEAHLKTPELEIYGHYLPLVPFPILGHTWNHAWGFTMSLTDDMDFYKEKLDRENKTALFKNKPKPYQTWTEVIQVKGTEPVHIELIETSHGPLLDAVLDEKDLSLWWSYLNIKNNPIKSLRGMAHAKKMTDFEESLKGTTAPGLNVMYADAENIAWWMVGEIPIRSNLNSDLVLDGASGKDENKGFLKWKEKPHSINPPDGFIVTANSKPPLTDSKIRGNWQSDNRFQTIVQALKTNTTWTVEETKTLQTSNFSSQTRLLLEKMLQCLRLSESEQHSMADVMSRLKSWNHHSTADSKEASLYHLWTHYNLQNLLSDLDSETREVFLNSALSWIFYENQILKIATCETENDMTAAITEGFRSAAFDPNALKAWGQIHTVEYGHPLGRLKPLNLIFNVGPLPSAGASNEINNMKYKNGLRFFPVSAGPSTRRIIDMSQPGSSWGINPLGVSGHLLSPYRKNEVEMFLQGGYRAQLLDSDLIEQAKAHELILIPAMKIQ